MICHLSGSRNNPQINPYAFSHPQHRSTCSISLLSAHGLRAKPPPNQQPAVRTIQVHHYCMSSSAVLNNVSKRFILQSNGNTPRCALSVVAFADPCAHSLFWISVCQSCRSIGKYVIGFLYGNFCTITSALTAQPSLLCMPLTQPV